MIITKREAERRNLLNQFPKICVFHQSNPDQVGIYSCHDGCIIIKDPCGCDEEMQCVQCTLMPKQEFLKLYG